MDMLLQRRLDRYVGVALCRLFSWLSAGRRDVPADVQPRRVLVILLSEMGSLVQAAPLFSTLRTRYPEASTHVLLFAKNREILDMMATVPPERLLTIRDESFGAFVRDSVRVFFRMRKLRFDTVIDCELFARISAVFSWLSGAAVRVGFHRYTQEGLYRGDFWNRPVLYNPYRHIAQQFVTLVDAVGSVTWPRAKDAWPRPLPSLPPLALPQEEISALRRRIDRDFPGILEKKLVLLNPSGGILPIRAWPLEHYARLAEGLLARGLAVAVTGMAGDRGLAEAIQARCRHPLCADLTGYTRTVRELMSLFHLGSLLVTNDGGPGHFALLTPIRSIIFFGPETPMLYGTAPEKADMFFLGLPCSPCLTAFNHRNSPCDGDNRCLKEISPEAVLARALEVLAAAGGVEDQGEGSRKGNGGTAAGL